MKNSESPKSVLVAAIRSQSQYDQSKHAPASNTGLSLFPSGFQAHLQGGVRGSPGTGLQRQRRERRETLERRLSFPQSFILIINSLGLGLRLGLWQPV